MFKRMDKKIISILRIYFWLNWPYDVVLYRLLYFVAGTFITIPLHEDESYDPVDAV